MQPSHLEHHIVYYDESEFAAWPFNGGFWQFADGELAVGFIRGKVDYQDPQTVGHAKVDLEGGEHVIMRSTDGGVTWPRESLEVVYQRPDFDAETRQAPVAEARQTPPVDPRADGFCLLSGYGISTPDAPAVAWVIISTDRGHRWSAPRQLPADDFTHMGGRPSYLVREDGLLMLFVHASRGSADESGARPVVYGSEDGGGSWALVGELPRQPERPMSIMPYPLQLPGGRLLAAVRRQYNNPDAFTQVYCSDDGGQSWEFLSRVNDWGAPANLNLLPDGRLVCTYGYRQQAWGIRARLSEDEGATWSDELILRDDGGSFDLGYPRTLLRPDGSLITVSYFNRADDPVQCEGGVRHIAATIWRP